MPKVTDRTTLQAKMTEAPEWVKKGKQAMDALPRDTQKVIVDYLFGLILSDVEDGLAGEDHEEFFEAIDRLYEAASEDMHKCFFCDTEDINAGLCLRCAMKIRELNQQMNNGRDLNGGKSKSH